MYHTIIIVGNLGKDPEMRYISSGQAVTNLSVAVNDNYTNSSGEKVDRTIWFRVSVWGRQAENCNQYLKKGRKVLVEGRMVADPATGGPRIWQGERGANANYEVSANRVVFLSSRGEAEGSQPGSESVPSEEDIIPF